MNGDHVGVVVGRFQVPQLHAGHRYLLNHVCGQHRDVLVVLGWGPARLTRRNPLDVAARRAMIQTLYPSVCIVELADHRSDTEWSAALDAVIAYEFPRRSAVLYGSRQSFCASYSGRHTCIQIPTHIQQSATSLRNSVQQPLASSAFRKGMIYASHLRYPTSYQTVDIAVLDERGRVLVGKKKQDCGMHRFIGGFVAPTDESLERAAKREVMEETSMIETDLYRYLGSFRVQDWRYDDKDTDAIMTAFFVAQYIFGAARASDDLDEVLWLPLARLNDGLVPEHQPLADTLHADLQSHLTKKGEDHANPKSVAHDR